jgi:hypothetical protein
MQWRRLKPPSPALLFITATRSPQTWRRTVRAYSRRMNRALVDASLISWRSVISMPSHSPARRENLKFRSASSCATASWVAWHTPWPPVSVWRSRLCMSCMSAAGTYPLKIRALIDFLMELSARTPAPKLAATR